MVRTRSGRKTAPLAEDQPEQPPADQAEEHAVVQHRAVFVREQQVPLDEQEEVVMYHPLYEAEEEVEMEQQPFEDQEEEGVHQPVEEREYVEVSDSEDESDESLESDGEEDPAEERRRDWKFFVGDSEENSMLRASGRMIVDQREEIRELRAEVAALKRKRPAEQLSCRNHKRSKKEERRLRRNEVQERHLNRLLHVEKKIKVDDQLTQEDIAIRKRNIDFMEDDITYDRAAYAKRTRIRQRKIAELHAEQEEDDERQRVQESILAEAKEAMNEAKARAMRTRAARLDATRAVDNHPLSKMRSYSRKCHICFNENPGERAVMITCGHFVCYNCAERIPPMQDEEGRPLETLSCPHCRRPTQFVRVFEDERAPSRRVATNEEMTSASTHATTSAFGALPQVQSETYKRFCRLGGDSPNSI